MSKQNMSKAVAKVLEAAIAKLRHGSPNAHPPAAATLREVVRNKGPIAATYELLLHLTGEYEKVRSNDTAEMEALWGDLADRGDEPKHQALVCYAKAVALFAKGGLAKQAEVEKLLAEAGNVCLVRESA